MSVFVLRVPKINIKKLVAIAEHIDMKKKKKEEREEGRKKERKKRKPKRERHIPMDLQVSLYIPIIIQNKVQFYELAGDIAILLLHYP